MTPRALFEHLQENPEAVSLFEDDEALLHSPQAVSVLRGALWAAPSTGGGSGGRVADRLVTWRVGRGGREEFMYSGGVIIIGNAPPPRTDPVNALLTRIPMTHL